MSATRERAYLKRQLEAHLTQLGYSSARLTRTIEPVPEVVRVNPVRGRIVYGEVIVRSDLQQRRCHERLLCFSQRRTRHRSSILFFIGVSEADEADLRALLEELDICTNTRGGHVHVVPIAAPAVPRQRATAARA